MNQPCAERSGDLATAAVGRLGGRERRALMDHVAGCAGCRSALSELEDTARLLPLVDSSKLVGGRTDGAPTGRISATGRRWLGVRWLAPAAALVAVGTVLAGVALSGGRSGQETVTLHGASGAQASAVLTPTSWGTGIELRASGQPNGQVFTVAMESQSGSWWQAGSYRTADGRADVDLTCGVSIVDIERIWVRNSAGRVVLRASLT